MIMNETGTSGILKIWLVLIVTVIGLGFAGSVITPFENGNAESAEENWNFKSTSISPEMPSSSDLVTFKLELNDDSLVSEVKIYICENNICGVPKVLDNPKANEYTYKSMGTYIDNSKVSYRFEVFYENSTKEKIPASSKTANAAAIQGSLYFEFNIGEHYNFASAVIEPAAPKETDLVKFTLQLKTDDKVEDVMIEIVQISPIFTPELPLKMQKSGDNTYTYTHTKTYDPASKVGYRFHVKRTDQDNFETIPVSGTTQNVIEEQGELYFSIDIAGDGDGDGDDDDKDDGGFLPGFGVVVVIVSMMLIVMIQHLNRKRKD